MQCDSCLTEYFYIYVIFFSGKIVICPGFFSSAIIDCGEPEPLLNGGVTFLSGFQNRHRSVVQYHCNEPFYSLPGAKMVRYLYIIKKISLIRINIFDIT